jgi:hypothetical protein
MRHVLRSCAAFALLSACASGGANWKEPVDEEPLPEVEGAADSARKPTEHGELAFGNRATATLTSAAKFHVWTFVLPGTADVAVRTEAASSGGREVDTMLYLYKQQASGAWGRNIASNDDTGASMFSALSRRLAPGTYRVLVKGYSTTTRGSFAVVADCTGEGCAPPPPPPPANACLFGDHFGGISDISRLLSNRFVESDASTLSPLAAEQLVAALQVSRHPEITTAEAALSLCIDHQAERVELYDLESSRAFTAWRCVLGDHWWGQIYQSGTTTSVARIVDDVFEGCSVGLETCMVGGTYRAFRDAETLSVVSDRVLTSPAGLSSARAAQLLAAVRESYADAASPADAFNHVDQGQINETIRRDAASGRTFLAYEFGAGDNSYGAFFEGSSATPVAVNHDGDVYECTVLRPAS